MARSNMLNMEDLFAVGEEGTPRYISVLADCKQPFRRK